MSTNWRKWLDWQVLMSLFVVGAMLVGVSLARGSFGDGKPEIVTKSDDESAPATGTMATPSPSATVAQSPPPNTPQRPPPNRNDGPWNNDLLVTRSADGLAFGPTALFVERGGVPSIIRDRDGRLIVVFQWFTFNDRSAFDRVAVVLSADDGLTWSAPSPVTVAGFPAEMMRPFDPTIVQLTDGRYRLYFTSSQQGASKPAIYSAISNDGKDYQFEPGTRFAPAAGTVDASVLLFSGVWHLFSHTQEANTGRGLHATSLDGLVWTVEAGTRLSPAGDPSAVILDSGEVLMVVVGPKRADAGPHPY